MRKRKITASSDLAIELRKKVEGQDDVMLPKWFCDFLAEIIGGKVQLFTVENITQDISRMKLKRQETKMCVMVNHTLSSNATYISERSEKMHSSK